MDIVSIVLFCITIGAYLARYKVRTKGADILVGVLSICTTMYIIQDTTIVADQLILFIMPPITILFMTFIHIMFGSSKSTY